MLHVSLQLANEVFPFVIGSHALMQHNFGVSEQNEIGMNWVLINNFIQKKFSHP